MPHARMAPEFFSEVDMADINEQVKKHDVIIRSRGTVKLDGIVSVISFDETSVCLESVMGDMLIEGDELHIGSLDTDKGIVELEGTINSLYYETSGATRKKGLFGRTKR